MYKELNISKTEGVWAAYLALCDLKEETERLQAACAAKEVELAELRGQTAELFGARLEAEGMGEEAVTAAKAMWQRDPQSVAMATLDCDFTEAANPWGCNQYGHRKGHSGGVGGSDAKNSEARSNLSDSDADFLTSDAYEIAMEEGGYEILYDTPKEKVKKAIRDTLKETGSASMLEGDTSALYSWWKKNKEKVVNKLKAESLQASNKHACEQESEQYSAEYYDVLECSHTLEEMLEDEEVAAANPYGCNQYGHEWRSPHGAGFGGKSGGKQDSKKETEKKQDTTDKPRGNAKPYSKPDSDSPEEFEKASAEKRAEIMQRWKNSIRKAQQALALYKSQNYKKEGSPEYESEKKRLQAEVEKEIEKFKDKVKKVGRLRGWDDKRSESVAKTLLIPVIS